MVWGIYLAAGQSKRMGRPKLGLSFGELSLGGIALETAIHSTLDGIVVVTQEDDPLAWIPPSLSYGPYREKWVHAPCRSSSQGQSESIKCGLRAAQEQDAVAVMILLADQPFTPVQMINHFVSIYKLERWPFITASHIGITRPPALFDTLLFPELLLLEGDEGARKLLRHRPSVQGLVIEYRNTRYFIDVDTPMDYQSLIHV